MPKDKKLVLVVEDDELYANIYKKKLGMEGYEVNIVGNGAWVLPAIKQHKPDLILLDLIMPVEDGFESLKALKKDKLAKDIPVVAVTNLAQEEDKQKAMDLGAVDYFVKTELSIDEMIEKIKHYL